MVYYRRRSYGYRRRPSGRRTSLPVRYRFGKARFARASRYRRRSLRKANWFSRKYNFKEKFDSTQMLQLPAGSDCVGGFSLQAVQLPAWAYRKPLADQYKIYKWKIEFVPQVMSPATVGSDTSGTTVAYTGMAEHALVPDYSDNSVPSSWGALVDNPLCIRKSIFHPIKMIIRPRVLKAAYEAGTTTGSAWMPGTGWIDCNDESTPHYGFKYMARAPLAHYDQPIVIRVRYTVYYGFKNTQSTN